MLDAIGWAATAIFSASYFFRRPAALRRLHDVIAAPHREVIGLIRAQAMVAAQQSRDVTADFVCVCVRGKLH